MLAAVISIPLLIKGIGLERFGALTLLWALLGYLALLDMGLVRSMVQIVAERLGQDNGRAEPRKLAEIIVPALLLITGIGILAAVILVVFANPLSAKLEADAQLRSELQDSLYIAAVIIPVALLSSGLRGLLEAHHHFAYTNLVRMIVGILNYLSPLLALLVRDSLPVVLAAVAAGRILGLLGLLILCSRLIPLGQSLPPFHSGTLKPLLSMGIWMAVNNLVGPIMMYADRFILGAVIAAGDIAYYTTPFEMVTRLLVLPAAISGVLFPLTARHFRQSPETLPHILSLGIAAILTGYGIVMIGVTLGGEWLLALWLGQDFAQHSSRILIILALGGMLNGLAYVPYTLLQGVGRVDITARLQLIELPFYLGGLWLLIQSYGPLGAAIAWGLRTGFDLFLLLFFSYHLVPQAAERTVRIAAVIGAFTATTVLGLFWQGAAGAWLIVIAQGMTITLALGFLYRIWRSRQHRLFDYPGHQPPILIRPND